MISDCAIQIVTEELRTVEEVLADLDWLRVRRIAGTVSEKEYHDEQDRLWAKLREIDRLDTRRREGEARIERDKNLQQRRDQRIARSKRKLEALVSQPPRRTVAELRRWLEAYIKIDPTNLPELRARQRRVEERMKRLTNGIQSVRPTVRPQLSGAERLRRRAVASGDADKAIKIAVHFHKFGRRLFVSKRAEIQYGPGGVQMKEWPRKYRPGVFPKVWKNAGVWIDYTAKQIVFENHKGEAKSRLPLPPMKLVTFDCLEDGDLWGIVQPNAPHIIERWGLDKSGITVIHGHSVR